MRLLRFGGGDLNYKCASKVESYNVLLILKYRRNMVTLWTRKATGILQYWLDYTIKRRFQSISNGKEFKELLHCSKNKIII